MANFQFGQDNVGSNWQVPSWYVQGMSQSPMAASIAGIGNSIAAFTSGYQAAKQAERNYGLEQQQMGLNERQVGLKEDEAAYRKKLLEDQVAAAEREKQRQERLRLRQLGLEGIFTGENLDLNSGTVPATPPQQQWRGVPYQMPTQYFGTGGISADVLSGLPTRQGEYPVNPGSLTGY